MRERQLVYAVTVWQERSFSRAAAKLGVTQPTVSDQIRRLEETVGFELFRRTGRGVEPTHKGKTFLHHSADVVAGLHSLEEAAKRLRGEPHRSFAVGFSSSLVQEFLPQVVQHLEHWLPRTRIQVTTATTRRVQRFVAEERLDAGITVEADSRTLPPQVLRTRIGEAHIVLILPPDHVFARSQTPIDLAAVARERLVVHETDLGYGEYIDRIFSEQGMAPKIAALADNIETVKQLVRSEIGLALVPMSCVKSEVALGSLCTRPITPAIEMAVTLVERELPEGVAASPLIETLRQGLTRGAQDKKQAPDAVILPRPALVRPVKSGQA